MIRFKYNLPTIIILMGETGEIPYGTPHNKVKGVIVFIIVVVPYGTLSRICFSFDLRCTIGRFHFRKQIVFYLITQEMVTISHCTNSVKPETKKI